MAGEVISKSKVQTLRQKTDRTPRTLLTRRCFVLTVMVGLFLLAVPSSDLCVAETTTNWEGSEAQRQHELRQLQARQAALEAGREAEKLRRERWKKRREAKDHLIPSALGDLICGIVFILVSVPLVLKKIPKNTLYGFRIPKAFRSEEDWYAINAYGGKAMIMWSIGLIVVGVVKFYLPLENLDALWAVILRAGPLVRLGPLVVCATGAIVQTLVYARKR